MNTVLIIPVCNEGNRIQGVLKNIIEIQPDIVIIVVDDGSSDNTFSVAKQTNNRIKVLRHRINLGKGAALKTGCEFAMRSNFDCIVVMDGDGQHDPHDISRLLSEMETKNLDIIFGFRPFYKEMPFVTKCGNKFLTLMTRVLFGIRVVDTQSGFRAFRTDAYNKLRWTSSRYSVETEMVVNTGKNKLRFGNIEVKTIYHDKFKGTTIIDGIRIFLNMLIWKFI